MLRHYWRLLKESRFHAEFVSAVLEWGSYPFPSRTRKSSPTSPMVPGPRIRESRSPLDSRGPLPRRQGASSFLRATARAGVLPGLRRGARSRRHGMSVHAACGSRPLRKILEGPFLFLHPPRMWLARSLSPPKGRRRLAQSPPARFPVFRAVSCARVSHAPLPRAFYSKKNAIYHVDNLSMK